MDLRMLPPKARPKDPPPPPLNDGLGSSDDEAPAKPRPLPSPKKSKKVQKKRALPTAKSTAKKIPAVKKSSKGGRRRKDTNPVADELIQSPVPVSKDVKVPDKDKEIHVPPPQTPPHSPPLPVPPKKKVPKASKLLLPSAASFSSQDSLQSSNLVHESLPPPGNDQASIMTLPPLRTTISTSPVQWLKDPPPPVPTPKPRGARRSSANLPPPFANDPVRGPLIPIPPNEEIEKLNGDCYLSTGLLDFVLQRCLPTLPDDVLIGSSNSLSWFESMNQKSDKNHKGYDPEGAKILRRKYQYYSLRSYQFLAPNCGHGHFSVAWVTFDLKNEDIFGNVVVYDSIRHSTRRNEKPKETSVLGMLLLELQKFLQLYCFAGSKGQTILASSPRLVLQKAVFGHCPQQDNIWDCALFAMGTLLHLLDGCKDVGNAFKPSHVKALRAALHSRLSTNTEITCEFLSSFFPLLRRDLRSVLSALPRVELDVVEENQKGGHKEENVDPAVDDPSIDSPRNLVYDVEVQDGRIGEKKDTFFCDMFMKKPDEDPKEYNSLAHLDIHMDAYEKTEGIRLIIRNSDAYSRIYICGSHIHCCFRAKFGKIRNGNKIVLKEALTHPYHSGKKAPTTAQGGRAHKKRLKGRIEESIDHAHNTQHKKPGAKVQHANY